MYHNLIEYIVFGGGIFRASLKFCMGGKLREEMEGDKRDEIMQIKFLQIVFLNNF
jgi:hypothetical protein